MHICMYVYIYIYILMLPANSRKKYHTDDNACLHTVSINLSVISNEGRIGMALQQIIFINVISSDEYTRPIFTCAMYILNAQSNATSLHTVIQDEHT